MDAHQCLRSLQTQSGDFDFSPSLRPVLIA
jgi:hypothetical protein